MEILTLAGSLLLSFIIFYVAVMGTLVILFKLIFKPVPEDELIEADIKKVLSVKRIKRTRKSFRPTLSIAK